MSGSVGMILKNVITPMPGEVCYRQQWSVNIVNSDQTAASVAA